MAVEAHNTLRTTIYTSVFLFLCGVQCADSASNTRDVRPYLKYFETLSYDKAAIHQQHHRLKRHIKPEFQELHLDFEAYQKVFHLRLKRDFDGFADDFKVLSENGSRKGDLSHVYTGKLADDDISLCEGSILEGQFEGVIKTSNGTFYVESLNNSTVERSNHSIIYHEDDIDNVSLGGNRAGFCATDQLHSLIQNHRQDGPMPRSRRTVDQSKTTCLLHLHVDYLFYQRFGSIERVIAEVATYIRAVNDIYHKADFDGIDVINFRVKSLSVVSEEAPNDPMQETYIGPEKLLSLFSETNWGNYCLSYLLTDRDFNGVLGLAWEGKPDDWGGICSRPVRMKDDRMSSLNTGLITLKNYGRYLPPKFVQLTFAHELGHSLGAPHDEGSDCAGPEITGGKGMFLMFPHATNEVKENSDHFSPCSLRDMSRLLKLKKDRCFVVSDQPICGNRILEKGEECDVGYNATDSCCYGSKEPQGIQCRLKPNKQCSPSQGLCCSSSCVFQTSGLHCEDESECRGTSVCTGSSAACPKPAAKPNMTMCNLGTRVCLNGECSRSLCMIHNLEQCDCPGENKKQKCHMCCQMRGDPNTCVSTSSPFWSTYFNRKNVALLPGAPCSKNQGYCDHFQTCRLLDADGPIARLKNSFLKLQEYPELADWIKAYWWAILLAILGISAVMAGTVCLFGHTLESDDTDKPSR